jgi:predicted Mrr-cat superfamily restriction endonuclease
MWINASNDIRLFFVRPWDKILRKVDSKYKLSPQSMHAISITRMVPWLKSDVSLAYRERVSIRRHALKPLPRAAKNVPDTRPREVKMQKGKVKVAKNPHI